MKKVYWLILVGLLLGCGSEAAPAATAVPTQPPTADTVAESDVVSTATAVLIQPSATPPPTIVPPTPRPPRATPTAAAPIVPELVWLPYATGNYGQPVLMLEDGAIVQQPLPVAVEIFFDYEAGWLAFGSKFWQATANDESVTDLHIYSFATGGDTLWADKVGRAALSPIHPVSGQPNVAAAIHNSQGFDLVVMLGPDNSIPLVEDVDPYFSWSPDGSRLAYLQDGELFVTSAATDSGNPPIAGGVYKNSQWIGDAPLWLGDSGYLLYADAPFTIVATDGSETIVPTAEDGAALQGPRPFAMLYSPMTNQLIAESEGMFGSTVLIYQLSDGFETAVPIQEIEDAQLAGWYEQNQSVIIISGSEATILPLTPQE